MPKPAGLGSPVASLQRRAGRAIARKPVRDFALLSFRLVGARAMSVVTLVVAAWLVNIETFAEFGVYQTLATLAWLAMFLRYDAAIVGARDEAEAGDVLRLCVCVGLAIWLICSGLALWAGVLGLMDVALALLLPLSILFRGILRLAFATATRAGQFKDLGRASMVQSLLQPTVLIVLVLSPVHDVLCFAVADIVGHAGGVAFLLWRGRRNMAALGGGYSWPAMMATATQWKSLPLYNLPGSFLALAFVLSPLLIVPLVADDVLAGHAALAYRIFDVPTQIFTAAATPIFLNRLRPSSEWPNPIFGRHMMLGLLALSGSVYAAMAGLLILADPWLADTALSGLPDVVLPIALFQLFAALAAPIGDACALYPQQRRLVLIHGLAVMASLGVALIASWYSPGTVLLSLAALSAVRTLALGELLRMLSRLSRNAFAAGGVRF